MGWDCRAGTMAGVYSRSGSGAIVLNSWLYRKWFYSQKKVRALYNNFDHFALGDFPQEFLRGLRPLFPGALFKTSSEKNKKLQGFLKSISILLSNKRRFLCLRPDKRFLCSDFLLLSNESMRQVLPAGGIKL
jgi:hypothetical protein